MVSDRITFGGLASGIDTNAIIDQLLSLQERPIFHVENRRFEVEQKRDAIGAVNTQLVSLLSAVSSLNDSKIVGARGTSVTSAADDKDAISAVADSTAPIGSFVMEVVSLATPTSVESTAVLGLPIAAAVPLDQAGFDAPIVAGTFTIDSTVFTIPAATPSTSVSSGAVGAGVDVTVALDTAGLTLAPVSGDFTINGTVITFDATTDSLNLLISRINGSSAAVTASFDTATDTLTLTSDSNGPTLITYSDGTGNFLEAMNFVDAVNAPTATDTAGVDLITLNDVVTMINGAAIGVTASITGGNLLELTAASNITVGAGGDTSNFLSVTHLLESPSGTTRTSVRGLGVVDLTAEMNNGRFATAVSPDAGSFKVNGVEISYDASVDSLKNVINRINQSAAGVTAFYDVYTDKLVFTAEQTGSSSIALESVSGNFLIATGLFGTTQTIGTNAQYTVDGSTQYSSSNTVTDAVAGVTITLREPTTGPVNIEVFSDTSVVSSQIQKFVDVYNKTMAGIRELTQFDEDGPNGLLFGDGTLRRLGRAIRSIITGRAVGFSGDISSLSSLGLTFGSVGAEVGTTDTLEFDMGTFSDAVAADADGVRQLLTAFSASAALDAGGTGSLASISGIPTTVKDSGTYTINSEANGDLTVTFTPDDGSTPVVSTGFISAGGTNTTLIPGVTLTAKGVLVAGVDTITITADQEGIAKALEEFIEGFTRNGGILDGRTEQMQDQIDDLNAQIERLERRLEARREQLTRKFGAMELTIARLQGQQSALTALTSQFASNTRARRR